MGPWVFSTKAGRFCWFFFVSTAFCYKTIVEILLILVSCTLPAITNFPYSGNLINVEHEDTYVEEN